MLLCKLNMENLYITRNTFVQHEKKYIGQMKDGLV